MASAVKGEVTKTPHVVGAVQERADVRMLAARVARLEIHEVGGLPLLGLQVGLVYARPLRFALCQYRRITAISVLLCTRSAALTEPEPTAT